MAHQTTRQIAAHLNEMDSNQNKNFDRQTVILLELKRKYQKLTPSAHTEQLCCGTVNIFICHFFDVDFSVFFFFFLKWKFSVYLLSNKIKVCSAMNIWCLLLFFSFPYTSAWLCVLDYNCLSNVSLINENQNSQCYIWLVLSLGYWKDLDCSFWQNHLVRTMSVPMLPFWR